MTGRSFWLLIALAAITAMPGCFALGCDYLVNASWDQPGVFEALPEPRHVGGFSVFYDRNPAGQIVIKWAQSEFPVEFSLHV